MTRYSRTKRRASKKKLTLAQKEKLKLKRKRAAAAKKGWATRKRNAHAQPRKAPPKKRKKVPPPKKRKKAPPPKKRKKSPAAKRKAQRKTKNKRIATRVEKRNKLRDKAKGKRLTPKRKKQLTKREREEKKRIEAQRLFDEKLRQIKEEQQRQSASKSAIVSALQKRFNSLLEEAKRTNQLPRVPRRQRIDSARFMGSKRHVNIGKVLLVEMVEEIMYRVKQVVAKMPRKPSQGWLAVINFASLGESLLGYGQVILRSSLPGASLFQTQGIDSSGIHNSPEGMLDKLEGKLEDLASDTSATVYVNFITVSAYQRRT